MVSGSQGDGKRRESRKNSCMWLSSPTSPAVRLHFEMQARSKTFFHNTVSWSVSTYLTQVFYAQSQFMQAQDPTLPGIAQPFSPHVCALSSFPCISSSDDETLSKLEQFLECVINRLSVLFFTMSFLAHSSGALNSYIGIRKVTVEGTWGEITALSVVSKLQVIFVAVTAAS